MSNIDRQAWKRHTPVDLAHAIIRILSRPAQCVSAQRLHPAGRWGQVPGADLVPRLSIGTLQLSIRCSSIHFLPSRSFPVSEAGEFEGRVAAPDTGGSRDIS
jgi:hypothetical protein